MMQNRGHLKQSYYICQLNSRTMFYDILWTFLISFSPFGEARVGIPYGVARELPLLLVFIIGLAGNLLVFPILYKAIEVANKHLWKHKTYKKSAIFLALRARTKTKNVIKKYVFILSFPE